MSVTTDPRSDRTSPLASSHVYAGPAFPTIYRREKENPGVGVQRSEYDDGTVSFMNASMTEPQPSAREKGTDRLAPMPENRRLGYVSVAALIINKMIGTMHCALMLCLLANPTFVRNWHLFHAKFNSHRHRWQQGCRPISLDTWRHHHISGVRSIDIDEALVINRLRSVCCYILSLASYSRTMGENLYM